MKKKNNLKNKFAKCGMRTSKKFYRKVHLSVIIFMKAIQAKFIKEMKTFLPIIAHFLRGN